jgi:hypothetical protein
MLDHQHLDGPFRGNELEAEMVRHSVDHWRPQSGIAVAIVALVTTVVLQVQIKVASEFRLVDGLAAHHAAEC